MAVVDIIGRMYRLAGSGLVFWRPGLDNTSPPLSLGTLLPYPLNYTGSSGLIRQLVKKKSKEKNKKNKNEIKIK
jgi:hypothetical protein